MCNGEVKKLTVVLAQNSQRPTYSTDIFDAGTLSETGNETDRETNNETRNEIRSKTRSEIRNKT